MAPMRCALTGTLITPNSIIIRRILPAQPRKPKYLEPGGDIVAAPLTLHQHPLHGGTVGIGLAYSGKMNQYVGAIDQQTDERRNREGRDWWLTEYGIRRVTTRFIGLVGVEHARKIMLALWMLHARNTRLEDVAEQIGESPYWVRKNLLKAQAFAR